MKIKNDYTLSSGNVFEDLGFENPEECLAKAELARQINNLIKQKAFTQKAAAEILNIDQPKVSALNKGKLSGFSLERLFRFLTILGHDVIIKVSPKKVTKKKAQVSVTLPKLKKETPINQQAIVNATRIQAHKKISPKHKAKFK